MKPETLKFSMLLLILQEIMYTLCISLSETDVAELSISHNNTDIKQKSIENV